jgi:hypothetical protein
MVGGLHGAYWTDETETDKLCSQCSGTVDTNWVQKEPGAWEAEPLVIQHLGILKETFPRD